LIEHRLVILFSGEGTNAKHLATVFHDKVFGNYKTTVALAICNNKNAPGIKKLDSLGIKTTLIEHTDFNTREEFDKTLTETIEGVSPSLTLLAGFMRILTPVFTKNIRALNIHPSLLPLHKGGNALKMSFEDSMKVAGVTVHFVNEELDSGEIVSQKCLDKIDGESFEDFQTRIRKLEHFIYPEAVMKVLGLQK